MTGKTTSVADPDPAFHFIRRIRIRLFTLRRIRIRLFTFHQGEPLRPYLLASKAPGKASMAPFWASTAPGFSLWCRSGSGFALWCRPDPAFHFDADPDSSFSCDADPDLAFHFDANPDLASQNDASPSGSGSGYATYDPFICLLSDTRTVWTMFYNLSRNL